MEEKLRSLERQMFASCSEEDIENYIRALKKANIYNYLDHAKILDKCGFISLDDEEDQDFILNKIADTLWANAYIDWIEEDYENRRHLGPGAGGEWFDVLPPTPDVVKIKARKFATDIEELHDNAPIHALYYIISDVGDIGDIEEFGYYITMEALGHGVSWKDNYPSHGLNIPYEEIYWSEIDMTPYEED